MAPPYSNGSSMMQSQSYNNNNNNTTNSHSQQHQHHRPYRDYSYSYSSDDDGSLADDCRALVRRVWTFARGRGRRMAAAVLMDAARQVRRNLAARRLLSFPHLVAALWVLVLLWGERWVFHTKVEHCDWRNWESWPPGATPHHLVFVADPQITDAHSYPGRPWPLSALTVLVTDNYLRRSYSQLQAQLRPDTVFFLGDLFDGGREWKPAHGDFRDPEWARRPEREKKFAKAWNKKYGEGYWLREYARFVDIFIRPWSAAVGAEQGQGQGQGRKKLVASLPGNHDLGFGSEVKLSVRNRFECYFGEGNRVDVVGNHTFVSVDTVSLSAGTSDRAGQDDVRAIYKPAEHFLGEVQWAKKKAVARELRQLRGEVGEVPFAHRIEDLDRADFSDPPELGGEEGQADLPTVLLTHVPLYRPPGTPCGPLREHWPPTKPPKGQTAPLVPDERNAISVSAGYQYQNVLSEADSVRLVEKIGNVVHAFSGDDHDYCEVVHAESQGGVREITVKSISMVMSVAEPGFLMVSLWNPIDAQGRPLAGSGAGAGQTMQTHLCLLPNQIATYTRYAALVVLSLVALVARAFLVPVLRLQPFALEPKPASGAGGALLPVFKAKVEEDMDGNEELHGGGRGGGGGSGASGFAARSASSPHSRDRAIGGQGQSPYIIPPRVASIGVGNGIKPNGLAAQARNPSPKQQQGGRHAKGGGVGRWGWGAYEERDRERERGPRIEIRSDDDFYDGGKWKAAARRGAGSGSSTASSLGVIGREIWTTVWRVAWIVVLFWGWLAYKG